MPDDDRSNVTPHPTARRRRHAQNVPPAPGRTPLPPRRQIGRPRRLTPETQDLLLGALRVGATFREAAAVAGVSEQGAHNWKARGIDALNAAGYDEHAELDADEVLATIPDTEHAFVEFWWGYRAVAAARNVAWLERINRSTDWKATAWLLKHHVPERYGDRLDVSVEVEVADPAEALLTRLARLRGDALDADAVETDPTPAPALPATPARRGRQTAT